MFFKENTKFKYQRLKPRRNARTEGVSREKSSFFIVWPFIRRSWVLSRRTVRHCCHNSVLFFTYDKVFQSEKYNCVAPLGCLTRYLTSKVPRGNGVKKNELNSSINKKLAFAPFLILSQSKAISPPPHPACRIVKIKERPLNTSESADLNSFSTYRKTANTKNRLVFRSVSTIWNILSNSAISLKPKIVLSSVHNRLTVNEKSFLIISQRSPKLKTVSQSLQNRLNG